MNGAGLWIQTTSSPQMTTEEKGKLYTTMDYVHKLLCLNFLDIVQLTAMQGMFDITSVRHGLNPPMGGHTSGI